MKVCRNCKIEKAESEYSPRYATCKTCLKDRYAEKQKAYYDANSDKICKRTNANYHANTEKYRGYKQEWRDSNRGKEAATRKQHREANIDHYRAKEALNSTARRRAIEQATPRWADSEAMLSIYMYAQDNGLHVDHVVPLRSDKVCGLHCEANLRAITQHENQIKGNKLIHDIV